MDAAHRDALRAAARAYSRAVLADASSPAVHAALRALLVLCVAVQLSGAISPETPIIAALTRELAGALTPATASALQRGLISIARALAVVAVLDHGRVGDAFGVLSTADRACFCVGLAPLSLPPRAQPSDGVLVPGGTGAVIANGSAPATLTGVEHALVAASQLHRADSGAGAGAAGGNVRRAASEVLAALRHSVSEGPSVIAAGERLAAFAAATPLSVPALTRELLASPRVVRGGGGGGGHPALNPTVWELIGHVAWCARDASCARAAYELGGAPALPALASLLLHMGRIPDALVLGRRCATVVDRCASGTGEDAELALLAAGGEAAEAAAEDAVAEYCASLPYRLTCWVIGIAAGGHFCTEPWRVPGGMHIEGTAVCAPQVCGSGGTTLHLPTPLVMSTFSTSAAQMDGSLAHHMMCPGAYAPSALLSTPMTANNAVEPPPASAAYWLLTDVRLLEEGAIACAPHAWSPGAAVCFLLRAAGFVSSSAAHDSESSGNSSSTLRLFHRPHTSVLTDSFAMLSLRLAAHVAANARARILIVPTASVDRAGSHSLTLLASGLEGRNASGEEEEATIIPSDPVLTALNSDQQPQQLLGWVADATGAAAVAAAGSRARTSRPHWEANRALLACISREFGSVGGVTAPATPLITALTEALSARASFACASADRVALAGCLSAAVDLLPRFAAQLVLEETLRVAFAGVAAASARVAAAGLRNVAESNSLLATSRQDAAVPTSRRVRAPVPPNAWAPGRWKVLAALESSRGAGGTMSSTLLTALRALTPAALSPSIEAAAALSPETLHAALLRCDLDHPILFSAMLGGPTCGDATLRHFLRQLQTAGNVAVGRVLHVVEDEGVTVQSSASSVSTPAPPAPTAATALGDPPESCNTATHNALTAIAALLDVVYTAAADTARHAANASSGEGGLETDTSAAVWSPLGRALLGLAPDVSSARSSEPPLLPAGALRSALLLALLTLWQSHVIDCASAVLLSPLHLYGIGGSASSTVGNGSGEAPTLQPQSSEAADVVVYATACATASACARALMLSSAEALQRNALESAASGGEHWEGEEEEEGGVVTSGHKPLDPARVRLVATQEALAATLERSAAAMPAVVARPLLLLLPLAVSACLDPVAAASLEAARRLIAAARPLRVADPCSILSSILVGGDSAHLNDAAAVGDGSKRAPFSPERAHPLPPLWAALLPLLHRDPGWRDFQRLTLLLLAAGVVHAPHPPPAVRLVTLAMARGSGVTPAREGGGGGGSGGGSGGGGGVGITPLPPAPSQPSLSLPSSAVMTLPPLPPSLQEEKRISPLASPRLGGVVGPSPRSLMPPPTAGAVLSASLSRGRSGDASEIGGQEEEGGEWDTLSAAALRDIAAYVAGGVGVVKRTRLAEMISRAAQAEEATRLHASRALSGSSGGSGTGGTVTRAESNAAAVTVSGGRGGTGGGGGGGGSSAPLVERQQMRSSSSALHLGNTVTPLRVAPRSVSSHWGAARASGASSGSPPSPPGASASQPLTVFAATAPRPLRTSLALAALLSEASVRAAVGNAPLVAIDATPVPPPPQPNNTLGVPTASSSSAITKEAVVDHDAQLVGGGGSFPCGEGEHSQLHTADAFPTPSAEILELLRKNFSRLEEDRLSSEDIDRLRGVRASLPRTVWASWEAMGKVAAPLVRARPPSATASSNITGIGSRSAFSSNASSVVSGSASRSGMLVGEEAVAEEEDVQEENVQEENVREEDVHEEEVVGEEREEEAEDVDESGAPNEEEEGVLAAVNAAGALAGDHNVRLLVSHPPKAPATAAAASPHAGLNLPPLLHTDAARGLVGGGGSLKRPAAPITPAAMLLPTPDAFDLTLMAQRPSGPLRRVKAAAVNKSASTHFVVAPPAAGGGGSQLQSVTSQLGPAPSEEGDAAVVADAPSPFSTARAMMTALVQSSSSGGSGSGSHPLTTRAMLAGMRAEAAGDGVSLSISRMGGNGSAPPPASKVGGSAWVGDLGPSYAAQLRADLAASVAAARRQETLALSGSGDVAFIGAHPASPPALNPSSQRVPPSAQRYAAAAAAMATASAAPLSSDSTAGGGFGAASMRMPSSPAPPPSLATATSPLARARAQMALLAAKTRALASQADALEQTYSGATAAASAASVEGAVAARGASLRAMRERADVLLVSTSIELARGGGGGSAVGEDDNAPPPTRGPGGVGGGGGGRILHVETIADASAEGEGGVSTRRPQLKWGGPPRR